MVQSPQVVQAPDSLVWQGDIYSAVPWGHIRDLDWVRTVPGNQFARDAPPPAGKKGQLVIPAVCGLGMLLTHECVVEKQQGEPLAFARVLPLAGQRPNLQEQIRTNRQ